MAYGFLRILSARLIETEKSLNFSRKDKATHMPDVLSHKPLTTHNKAGAFQRTKNI